MPTEPLVWELLWTAQLLALAAFTVAPNIALVLVLGRFSRGSTAMAAMAWFGLAWAVLAIAVFIKSRRQSNQK